jgi:hypothetical protein
MFIRNYFYTKAKFNLFFFISNNSFCQTISGIVLDRETKNPWTGVNVYSTNREQTKDIVSNCFHIVN